MQIQLTRRSIRSAASVALMLLAGAVVSQAQQPSNQKTSAIKIKNFGQMDERFYRGARPKTQEDFNDLAAMGIKTVIDLTEAPKEDEKIAVESAGMKYVHIPMVEKKYPTEAATSAFLKIANDPGTGKFFLHCAGGRHRTGALGAVYRYQNYNWNFEQVYAEMKKYDFYTSWGHGAFKDFVKDYYDQLQTAKAATQAATTAESAAAQTQDQR
ncbi:MAG TPA: tyrosine-protein phosphatase [Pyrinomonadaceae bacterium]|nr:tyrosine-protein phosphatase [Pyrinomonadaceae bacterium]